MNTPIPESLRLVTPSCSTTTKSWCGLLSPFHHSKREPQTKLLLLMFCSFSLHDIATPWTDLPYTLDVPSNQSYLLLLVFCCLYVWVGVIPLIHRFVQAKLFWSNFLLVPFPSPLFIGSVKAFIVGKGVMSMAQTWEI